MLCSASLSQPPFYVPTSEVYSPDRFSSSLSEDAEAFLSLCGLLAPLDNCLESHDEAVWVQNDGTFGHCVL